MERCGTVLGVACVVDVVDIRSGNPLKQSKLDAYLIGGSKSQNFNKLLGIDKTSCAKISTGGRLGGGGPLRKTKVKAKKRKAKKEALWPILDDFVLKNVNPGGKRIKLEVEGDL